MGCRGLGSRVLVVAVAGLAGSGWGHAKLMEFNRTVYYEQTSAAQPAGPVAFGMDAQLFAGEPAYDQATLTSPGTAGAQPFSAFIPGAVYELDLSFASEAELSAAYPAGAYYLDVATTAGETDSLMFRLDDYPQDSIPYIIDGGFERLQAGLDPDVTHDFRVNEGQFLGFGVAIRGGGDGFSYSYNGGHDWNFTLTPDTLQPNTTYELNIRFFERDRVRYITPGPLLKGTGIYAYDQRQTTLTFTTLPEPATALLVAAGLLLMRRR